MVEKHGRYTVLEKRYDKEREKSFYLCRCDCGKEKWVRQDHLKSGATISCGCYHSEVSKKVAYRMGKLQITHGETYTRLHIIWRMMKQRCTNPKHKSYKYYGLKGIKICEAWISFENFRDWARASGYRDDLTIDRIDNSKGYEPQNCRWATLADQSRNRSFVKNKK